MLIVNPISPELTNDLEELTRICSYGRLYETAGMLGILLIGAALQVGLNLSVVQSARVAQVLAVGLGAPFCVIGMSLYQHRKRNREPRKGYGLCFDGVVQMCAVWKSLRMEYPDCGKFLLAMCFFEAATGTVTIAAVILLDLNGMRYSLITPYLVVVMITMLFGPFVNIAATKNLGIKNSFLAALLVFIVLFIVFALLIRDPAGCWILAPFTGVAYGWYYPAQASLFSSLVPARREAEVAGLNNFCSLVISWVPTLILTAGSESGQMRLSILVLPLFWVVGGIICFFVDTDQATQIAAREKDKAAEPKQSASGEAGDLELQTAGNGSSNTTTTTTTTDASLMRGKVSDGLKEVSLYST